MLDARGVLICKCDVSEFTINGVKLFIPMKLLFILFHIQNIIINLF